MGVTPDTLHLLLRNGNAQVYVDRRGMGLYLRVTRLIEILPGRYDFMRLAAKTAL